MIETINPATGKMIKFYPYMEGKEVENILEKNHQAFLQWRRTEFSERAQKMNNISQYLIKNKIDLSKLITEEMGKNPEESQKEIEKCSLVCQYFSENAEAFLAPKPIKTQMKKSYVRYNPLGSILAIMPWNYPFWQVFRFAAPAIMAGNAAILKHAPITTGSGLAIEKVFRECDFPEHLFRTVLLEDKSVDDLIKNSKIAAVTLTGSVRTGRSVAKEAGYALKKVVLELGGADPYIILEDANIDLTVETIVQGRMQNSGQSCIAPKRILIIKSIFNQIQQKMVTLVNEWKDKNSLAPLARADLRGTLDHQVQKSIILGAHLLTGGSIPEGSGFFYPPTILSHVKQGMPAYEEELFGPVITLIEVDNEREAVDIANSTQYGLGAAVFTENLEKGEKIAAEDLEAGVCFVNDFVKSDPQLPFGGVKASGFGRELSEEGIKEFVNIKTVVIK